MLAVVAETSSSGRARPSSGKRMAIGNTAEALDDLRRGWLFPDGSDEEEMKRPDAH